MARSRRSLVLLAGVLQGCSGTLLLNGGIYSHTTEPLTFNPNPTLLAQPQSAKGEINEIKYPLSSLLSVRVGSTGIADVAKAHGMNTVYYADIEKRSALFGLWSTETVHIYGR